MKKVFLPLIVFLIFSSCGYTPKYSNKNFDFDLSKITKKENNRLNSKIVRNLNNFSNRDNKNKINIEIDAKKIINVVARDNRGNASRYEMIISIYTEVIYRENKKNKKTVSSSFNYNTNNNRFKLSQYEKEIEELLIQKVIEDLISYLSSI